jgi:hypothetical protein
MKVFMNVAATSYGGRQCEDPPALHHLGDTGTDNGGGIARRDVVPVELDPTLGRLRAVHAQEPGDSAQQGRLAGSVRTQQGDDGTPRHLDAHASKHQDHVVVDDLEVVDVEHR